MSQAAYTDDGEHVIDSLVEFYKNYYDGSIKELAQAYPKDSHSLYIEYDELYRFSPEIAHDLLAHPHDFREYLEEALQSYEVPIDVSFSDAHVRVEGLPETQTYYPNQLSPSDHRGNLRAITGEISKVTDVYVRLKEAAFECQHCDHVIRVPQSDGSFQEPYECNSCERQPDFEIDYDKSEYSDGQKIRLKTPPDIAQGDGRTIDGYVNDDLTGTLGVGDRVTLVGEVHLEQQGNDRSKKNKFDPFLHVHSYEIQQTDAEDVDISPAQKERIRELAAAEAGDPLELAAQSLAPKIHGHSISKKAIILSLVGGSRVEYDSGDFDRGQFHVLLIGDPSTGKSKLVNQAERVGWRAVGVSGKGSTVAGVTASAVQDDFADGSWTLESGAFVKANKGVVAVDELDDMPSEVRAALLEPMSKQKINVNKGGINATLETRASVVAAANPDEGRFDQYETLSSQFVFSDTLLSRFDLVYTFMDEPDEQHDTEVSDHILSTRDAQKRRNKGKDATDMHTVDAEPEVSAEILRRWVALAKQQPQPHFADESVKDRIQDEFTKLRGFYDYDSDEPVPVTYRSLEGIVRVAEAAAKFEFSDTIQQRHVDIATTLVGESMQDVGQDEEGNFDADVKETGESKSQRDRKKVLRQTMKELQKEYDDGKVPVDDIINELDEFPEDKVQHDIESLKERGEAYYPKQGLIRYVGD